MTIAAQLGRVADISKLAREGRLYQARLHVAQAWSCFRGQRTLRGRASQRPRSQHPEISGERCHHWRLGSDRRLHQCQEAFQQSLRDLSVFDTVLSGGMVRAPLRSRGFSITTGIGGSVVPGASVKPISSLVLGRATVRAQEGILDHRHQRSWRISPVRSKCSASS